MVLVGEGRSRHKVTQLLEKQKRRHEKVVKGVPVHTFQGGENEGQVPMENLTKTLYKLPKRLNKAEILAVRNRLTGIGSLATRPPIPQGRRSEQHPSGPPRTARTLTRTRAARAGSSPCSADTARGPHRSVRCGPQPLRCVTILLDEQPRSAGAHDDGAGRQVVESAAIGIGDDDGEHQADEHRPDERAEQADRPGRREGPPRLDVDHADPHRQVARRVP